MTKTFRVSVVTGQGGGGHYATYDAVCAIAQQKSLPWEFQVTDMDDIITELSRAGEVKNAYEMFGISGHDLYNLMVKGGWTWLWPLKMRLNKLLVRLNHQIGIETFTKHWQQQQPDIVVSVMPLYNKGLYESLQRAKPGTPYITVMTDFADCPPDFWLDPEANNTLVCGTQRAMEQARSLDISEDRLVRSSGLVIHPDFYQKRDISAEERTQQRLALGLAPDRATGIVMFGGNGASAMLDIANRLEALADEAQFIFACGHNLSVAQSLRRYQGPQPRVVLDFVDNIADYLRLSDFFVGKPGNVSVSEALAMRLPVITVCNRMTMSQEKYCAEWVAQQEVGTVLKSFKQVDRAVAELLQPATYNTYKANLENFDNRAVFELAALISEHLAATAIATSPAMTSV
ncbi:MAG: glycosyltransferase [Cyanobacteria bacterium J06614_10]